MTHNLRASVTGVALLLAAWSVSQPTLAWTHRYDGPTHRYDSYQVAEVDPQGNTYLLGLEMDSGATGGNPKPLVMKVGPSGAHLWTAPLNAEFGDGHLPKRAVVTATSVYVAGTISATGPFGTNINQSTIWKFNAATGALEWRRVFTDAPFAESIAQDIVMDPLGNVAVCGTVYNDSGFYPGNDAFIQKFSPSGVRLWSTNYSKPINGFAWGLGFHFVKSDSDGNFLVAGSHSKGGPSEAFVHKYDGASGQKIWETTYEGNAGTNTPNTLMLASDGDPIVALNTQVTIDAETRSRIGVMRLDGVTGSTAWLTIETLPLFYQFTLRDQVALDPNDNVVATLMYDTDGNALAQYRNNNSMRTFKFDGASGARVWAVDHGNNIRNDFQNPTAIQTDASGNVYVIGHETLPDAVNGIVSHTMIRRHDAATGQVSWYEQFVGEGFESGFRARFDANGDLYIAGISGTASGTQDFWASKWNTAHLRLSLAGNTVVGGNSTTGTVALPSPAAGGQALVRLTDDSPFVLTSSNCIVPVGQSSGTFTIWTYGVAANTLGVLSASYGGQTATASVMLTPATLDLLWLSPTSVVGGNPSLGNVRLTGKAPQGGKVVTLQSSDPAVAGVGASTSIAYGASLRKFPVSTFGVDATKDVLITATLDGVVRQANLRVRPASLSAVSVATPSVVGGSPVVGSVTFNGKTGPAGRTVQLTSSHAAAQVPASMYMPPQRSTWTFNVATSAVVSPVKVTLTAIQGAVTRTAQLDITP